MNFEERLRKHEERYWHEIDAREKIESRIKTPFSMFLIVFGLIAYLFKETFLSDNLNFSWYFWIAYVSSIILFVTSIGFFLRAIYGYHYLLMPTPEVLELYFKQILDDYKKTDRTKANFWTREAFKEYLFNSYVTYTTQNTKNNDSKSLNINRCIGSLIASFVIVCLSYIPYYLGTTTLKENHVDQQTTSSPSAAAARCERSTTQQTTKTNGPPSPSGTAEMT